MMEFTIRQLISDDYEKILVDWWRAWGWTPPVKDFLPDNGKGGVIIYDGETPICAGFIYITNSKVAWVDWIVSNKEYTHRKNRQKALSLLIEKLTESLGNKDYKYAYALLKNDSLIKTYEKAGYVKGEQYTMEMIKLI